VQRVLILFIKLFEKNVLSKTLGSKRKDTGIMEERRNLIMGTFMVTSSTRNYLLNRNKNPLIKGTLIMNREIRNMHKTFELKTRRKWNT